MLKCGDKFCSNRGVNDVQACCESRLKNNLLYQGRCFWHTDGQGCQECGGRVIRANGCYVCVECGYSPCG